MVMIGLRMSKKQGEGQQSNIMVGDKNRSPKQDRELDKKFYKQLGEVSRSLALVLMGNFNLQDNSQDVSIEWEEKLCIAALHTSITAEAGLQVPPTGGKERGYLNEHFKINKYINSVMHCRKPAGYFGFFTAYFKIEWREVVPGFISPCPRSTSRWKSAFLSEKQQTPVGQIRPQKNILHANV